MTGTALMTGSRRRRDQPIDGDQSRIERHALEESADACLLDRGRVDQPIRAGNRRRGQLHDSVYPEIPIGPLIAAFAVTADHIAAELSGT
jgi:hypothetical protein